MKYLKNVISFLLIGSFCVSNITAFASDSSKLNVQKYFNEKAENDRENTEIIRR